MTAIIAPRTVGGVPGQMGPEACRAGGGGQRTPEEGPLVVSLKVTPCGWKGELVGKGERRGSVSSASVCGGAGGLGRAPAWVPAWVPA